MEKSNEVKYLIMDIICSWYFQNVIFLFVSLICFLLYNKYNIGFFELKKEREKPISDAIESWSNTQGWLFVIGLFLIFLFYSLDKEPIFSGILSYFGISFC